MKIMNKVQFESIKRKCIANGAGIYDAELYRYVLQDDGTMKRCKRKNLDTTAMLNDDAWETVSRPE